MILFFSYGPSESMRIKFHGFHEILHEDGDFHKDMKSMTLPGRAELMFTNIEYFNVGYLTIIYFGKRAARLQAFIEM